MTKTELKQTIKEVIQEELKGYSQYTPGGVTKGGTTDDFRQILTKIAKGEPPKSSSDIKENEGKEYEVEYAYRYGKDGDETDFDIIKVKASSPSEAIEKAKQQARRLAIQSSFEIKK
jgi:hypothetical protein